MTKQAVFGIDESTFEIANAVWEAFEEQNHLSRGPAIFRTITRIIYEELFSKAIVKYLTSPDGSVEFFDGDVYRYPAAEFLIKAIFDDPNVLVNGILIESAYATFGDEPNTICKELAAKICSKLNIPDVDEEDGIEDLSEDDGNRLLRLARKTMDLSADEELIAIIIEVLELVAIDAISTIDWSIMADVNEIAAIMEKTSSEAVDVDVKERCIIGTF